MQWAFQTSRKHLLIQVIYNWTSACNLPKSFPPKSRAQGSKIFFTDHLADLCKHSHWAMLPKICGNLQLGGAFLRHHLANKQDSRNSEILLQKLQTNATGCRRWYGWLRAWRAPTGQHRCVYLLGMCQKMACCSSGWCAKHCTQLGCVLAEIWDRRSLPDPYITIIPGDGSLRLASRNPDPKPSN